MATSPLSQELEHDDPLPLRQHGTTERHHPLAAHGFADHGKRFLPDATVWRDVVGALQISLVDLLERNERVDFDGVSALDRNSVEFVIVHRNVCVLCVLVAAALILALDRFAGDLVDQLLAQAVASLLGDLAK